MKYLLLLLLLSTSAFGNCFIGFNKGTHLIAKGLNDSHPLLGCETDDRVGIVAYLNSYEKVGVGVYDTFTTKVGKYDLSLKVGATTGYKPEMEYKGRVYHVPEKAFITHNIMALVIPAIEYNTNKARFSIEVLGDAVGLSVRVFTGGSDD